MQDIDPLITERLRVRRLQRPDLARFAAYRADPELARYQGWSAMSEAEALAFIEEMQHAPAFVEEAWLQLAIAQRAEDALVGDIGLCLHAGGEAEIGFTLMHEAQGQGLATEALAALMRRLWAQPGVRRVIGITDARNRASIRVLERLGLRLQSQEDTVFKGEPCTELRYVLDAPPCAGGCYCGAVSFSASTAPRAIINCHCGQCRRLSGAAFSTWVSLAREDVMLAGADCLTPFNATLNCRRHFCRHCGSHVFTEDRRMPDILGLPAGVFSSTLPHGPSGHYFVDHQVNWHTISDTLPCHGGESGSEKV